jgi:uncharacterized membrane protein
VEATSVELAAGAGLRCDRILRMPSFSKHLRLDAIRERLATSLTLIPGSAMLLALAMAMFTGWLDEKVALDFWYTYGGQPRSARELLSTLSSAVLSITGVVFSITILVLQLANTQFSSRVLKTFLKDKQTQLSMGVLLGSFVYSVALLPSVRDETFDHPEFVPELSITIALGLALLSVAFFIRYIHHMAHSIRAVEVVHRIASETRASMQRMYPELAEADLPTRAVAPERPEDHLLTHDGDPGVLVSVDEKPLLDLATKHDVFIELLHHMGDFVPRDAPIFRVWGASCDPSDLKACVGIDQERTHQQDPAFGLRQLVDIAERALSPGVNDPTTAVQALDQIHDLLRWLSRRAFPSPVVVDASGVPRLLLPRPDFAAYVHLGLDESRQFGGASVQIARRLRGVLEDLLRVASEPRKHVLWQQLQMLDAVIARKIETSDERELSREASSQSHGPSSSRH